VGAEFANAVLVELAHECRDLALIMATSRGMDLDLEEIDAQIIEMRNRWYRNEGPGPVG
jgi:hypothetical protein